MSAGVAMQKFARIHHGATDKLRYGQRFCNMYLLDAEKACPGLYNMTNEGKAKEIVREWLEQHHYTDELPPVRASQQPTKLCSACGRFMPIDSKREFLAHNMLNGERCSGSEKRPIA